ncbi:TPA: preprotein translocase subunit SecA [Candidatus Uhrbacteria bacterium]|nr:preprotein translocase subunit SecA [Candidatus Uhrbacteria bacterium]
MAHFLDRFLTDTSKKTLNEYQKSVYAINALSEAYRSLSDAELKEKTVQFKARLGKGEPLDTLLVEAFATVREAARRTLGQYHYDVQLLGGMALHHHNIAEMRTGEGKTLTSTLPVYLNALEGKGVHIATVNDYLSLRDAAWMGQIFDFLGLSVGVISHEGGFVYDESIVQNEEQKDVARDVTGSFKIHHDYLRPVARGEAYLADVTYGTNNEFGFDYLRDNMVQNPEQRVQRPLYYCLIDEVDSILIDEARTPLIISAPSQTSSAMYQQFAQIARLLQVNTDYNIDEKMKVSTLTEVGIEKVEKSLGLENLYADGGVHLVHHLEQALRAEVLYKRDKEYVVREGEIVIVDEFTGRMMEGRRFSEGLHQAIEAKEGVEVQQESQTLATITFQNYFRMYTRLAGMTGTAKTEEEEFQKIYNLNVIVLPTNKQTARQDNEDKIYRLESGKIQAIVRDVKERQVKGQPVLIGTISIEKNEKMSKALTKAGVPHEALNAKNHEREGEIIAQAGRRGAVTVATNMAGRGVDIKLGGVPATQEEYSEVIALGGLYVIGTERHEARRIDNQLRGRSGRQGDVGETQFYVSTEDDLMRVFGSERMKNMMGRLGVPDDMPIENKATTKALESAQKKVEGHNFDIRKRLLDYDDILNKQRSVTYDIRNEIVEINPAESPEAARPMVLDHVTEEIENVVSFHTADGTDWNVQEIFETMQTIVPVPVDLKARFMTYNGIGAPKAAQAAVVRTELIEALEKQAEVAYGELEGVFADRSQLATVEKQLLLRSIDMLWVEHLTAMRKLRSGVGLSGYAQRDPLVEYKRESFAMYQVMLSEVQKQVVYSIFKVKDAMRIAQAPSLADRAKINDTIKAGVANQQKPGRNDACPCGSGKKYKKCHGGLGSDRGM